MLRSSVLRLLAAAPALALLAATLLLSAGCKTKGAGTGSSSAAGSASKAAGSAAGSASKAAGSAAGSASKSAGSAAGSASKAAGSAAAVGSGSGAGSASGSAASGAAAAAASKRVTAALGAVVVAALRGPQKAWTARLRMVQVRGKKGKGPHIGPYRTKEPLRALPLEAAARIGALITLDRTHLDVRRRCKNKSIRGVRIERGGVRVELSIGSPCAQLGVFFEKGGKKATWGGNIADAALAEIYKLTAPAKK